MKENLIKIRGDFMAKRRKDDIIATFLGTSNNDVTGSSLLLNVAMDKKTRCNILIEMGLCQGNATIEKDVSSNKKMLERYPKEVVANIEYVLLGHAHVLGGSCWQSSVFKF